MGFGGGGDGIGFDGGGTGIGFGGGTRLGSRSVADTGLPAKSFVRSNNV
jgi:hypothetical protein